MALDWSRVAFVFPGQGSQSVGMGKDMAAAYPVAADIYRTGDEVLGYALSDMMFSGTEGDLALTLNTQPAMYINSMAILRTLQNLHPEWAPAAVAGHSLGELTAITATGALRFDDGVGLVKQRARLMALAGQEFPGSMAAILNLELTALAEVCQRASAQTGKIVVVANDNCPGQIVISGDHEALEVAITLAKEAGAKRALKLNVSTANHSPLMKSAEDAFAYYVLHNDFMPPVLPCYANLTAEPLPDEDAIRDELSLQMTRAVRWADTIRNMIAAGITTFVEIGNKDVLSGLIKRTSDTVTTLRISDVASLEAFIAL